MRELQTYLRQLSFFDPRIPKLAIDGVYGPETTRAVRIFQEDNGLPPTGYVDLETWNAIVKVYNMSISETGVPSPIAPFPSAFYVLKPGARGDIVSILQIMLNHVGRYYSNTIYLLVNGVYNQDTYNAVKIIQKLMALKPTGTVDVITWNALASAFNEL